MIEVRLSRTAIVIIALIIVSFWGLLALWPVVLLVLVAFIFMIGLLPYVEALVNRGIPRPGAVFLVLLVILTVTAGLFSLVVPAMIDQFSDIRNNLPASARELEEISRAIGVDIELEERAREVDWDQLISGRAAVGFGQRVLAIVFSIVTIVVMTAYLLVDMPKLARFLYQFFPPERDVEYDRLFQSVSRVVGGYLRGQLLTSLAIGLFTFVVLTLVGVPNALAFAVLAGFADVIPLIGAFIAIIPPVIAALQESSTQALVVFGALIAYQQFEDRVIVPRVYGQTLNLPPIIVLIAVLAGAQLLGITGVLLALPLTAAARVWLDYLLEKRGISLSPAEPHDEPVDETEQPFAPDNVTPVEEGEAAPGVSILALAGQKPRLVDAPSEDSETGPEAPSNPGSHPNKDAVRQRRFRRR